jgi:leucyl/phenylalanyl-tRNA--protein transferase
MLACAAPRPKQEGTWIHTQMIDAYCELHRLGYARSIECYLEDKLVGGIYGVQLGRVFFGESMFHTATNASKAALVEMAKQPEVALIDCQIPNEHLKSMGMIMIPRQEFMFKLEQLIESDHPGKYYQYSAANNPD